MRAPACPTSGYCYAGARTLAKAVLILESGITGFFFLYETLLYLVQCHLAHVPGTYNVFVL